MVEHEQQRYYRLMYQWWRVDYSMSMVIYYRTAVVAMFMQKGVVKEN